MIPRMMVLNYGQMDKFVTLKFKRTGKKEIGSQG